MGRKKLEIKWLDKPQKHDFPAAESYLGLIFPPTTATRHIKKLRHAPMSEFKAKDILRASNLSRLGVSNSHVERDRDRIIKGDALSPVLLVRDNKNARLIIADGYHRLCAVYSIEEDATIPCRIV
jgi:hypothetical protein